MAHMQPQIQYGEWLQVETNIGTETIPSDLVDMGKVRTIIDNEEMVNARLYMVLRDYLEGSRITGIEIVKGWGARLSAPGYLDCTEWSVYGSEQAAREALEEETEGDEPEETDSEDSDVYHSPYDSNGMA